MLVRMGLVLTSLLVCLTLNTAFATEVTQEQNTDVADHTSVVSKEIDKLVSNVKKLPIKVNGFISVGGGISDVPRVINPFTTLAVTPDIDGINDQFNFNPYTLAGIQFELDMSDTLSFITQLIARGTDNYDIRANWAYLRYRPNENWNIQVGRVRIPTFLLSEYIDVGYAYPWITPPTEVYGLLPIPNVSGGQVIFSKEIHGFDLEITPFVGTSDFDMDIKGINVPFEVRNLFGAEVSIGNDIITIRGSVLHTQLTAPYFPLLLPTPPFPAGTIFPSVRRESTIFWGVGLQLNWHDIAVLSEYTQRRIHGYMPDSNAWYAMIGYHIGPVMPNLTYSQARTVDKAKRGVVTGVPFNDALLAATLNNDQHTWEFGIRYDVTSSVALKASYQRVTPDNLTAGSFTANPGRPVNVFNIAVQAIV